MIVDARTLPPDHTLGADLCIVGAGPAGIAIARELTGSNARVCVLESGGLEADPETQSLAAGESTGQPYYPLEATRLRFFGGTANHWEGLCRELDNIDFERREGFPHSGWPFSKNELAPYYQRAQAVCQLGPANYDPASWAEETCPPLLFAGNRVRPVILQMSPATRFGAVYRPVIEKATNVTAYLHANAVEIETDEGDRHVTGLQVATLAGNRFRVTAKQFVLATGGIENARLLLLTGLRRRVALGNNHDLVGRFFMEHPEFESGLILLLDPNTPAGFYQPHAVRGFRAYATLSLAEDVLRAEQLPNFSLQMWPATEESVSAGVQSAGYLRRALRRREMPDNLLHHLRNVLADLDDVLAYTYRQVMEPGQATGLLRVFCLMEQHPDPESRIRLSDARDRLGQPRAHLHWQLDSGDKHRMRRAHEILATELGRSGLGRLRLLLTDDDRWPESTSGTFHHMGTTRMHVDPQRGVVDANCRVHGIANLFVAGSSVFPTVGAANPTLTIVALALRLADHLRIDLT